MIGLLTLVGCRSFQQNSEFFRCLSCEDTTQVYRLVTYGAGNDMFIEHAIEIQTIRQTDTIYNEITYKDLK